MAKRGGQSKNREEQAGSAAVTLPGSDFLGELQEEILGWFETNGRDLPWRRTRDPYAILVSELMLQQTQALRVVPKYELFLARFPTAQSLAKAPLGDVLRQWSGLGYNRRAQYLHRAAHCVVFELGEQFPTSAEGLRRLPGVGPYTAGAIAAFAYNQDTVILETNIRRIFQLLFTGTASERADRIVAESLLPKGRARDWYHALMDLATVIRIHRSALAQQDALRELFPMLAEHTFPRLSEDRLLRPRQSAFLGSPRYFRGQILKRLQAGAVSAAKLGRDLEKPQSEAAIEALLKEGLVVYEPFDDLYRLPD